MLQVKNLLTVAVTGSLGGNLQGAAGAVNLIAPTAVALGSQIAVTPVGVGIGIFD